MIESLAAGNLALRFLVEVAALAALAVWGSRLRAVRWVRWSAAVLAPATAATVWAAFASPDAPISLGSAATTAVQVAVLGAGAAALTALRRPQLAMSFVAVATMNAVAMEVAGQ